MKYKLLMIIAAVSALMITGCQKGESDDRILAEVNDADIQEIKDFSYEFSEQMETEEMTETDMKTEAPVETEQETEALEEIYSKDYDFSEKIIAQAVFGTAPYTQTISQDYRSQVRTVSFSSVDGLKKVSLYADTNSGNSNSKVILDFGGANAQENLRESLLKFENGIDEERMEAFLANEYCEQRAGYLGLKNASVVYKDRVVVTLEKDPISVGKIPGWADFDMDCAVLLNSPKFSGLLSDQADLFGSILGGIDFGAITMDSSTMNSWEKTYDEHGTVSAKKLDFTASYHSDRGNRYEIQAQYFGTADDGIIIKAHRKDIASPQIAMNLADFLYQKFFEGSLDVTAALDVPFQNEHCKVELIDGGFQMRLF